MKSRLHKIISLIPGVNSLTLTEVTQHHGTALKVVQTATFAYPEGVTLANPAELGQALQSFIRQRQFSTRHCVMGLWGRQVLVRAKTIPPMTEALARAALRLQAEAEFTYTDEGGYNADFIGTPRSDAASTILLVAAPIPLVEQYQALAKAAGLLLTGITLIPLTLAITSESAVWLMPDGQGGTDLMVQADGLPVLLRHLPVDITQAEALPTLAGDIRRSFAGLSLAGPDTELKLWDVSPANADLLALRLGMKATVLPTSTLADSAGAAPGAASLGLARAALSATGLPLNFAQPRLSAPPPPSRRRLYTILSLLGVIVLLLVGWALLEMWTQQTTLAETNTRLKTQDPAVAKAQRQVDQLRLARSYGTGKPLYLACLRDLTNLFPDDGVIWTTNISLQANQAGMMTGKATSESQVRALVNRMIASKQFLNAKVVDLRDASRGGAANEKAFTISFTYKVPE
ncbi:MAG: PilN domain-containing protein [Phycisphaerae bacterium]